MARSGLVSPLKSAIAMALGLEPAEGMAATPKSAGSMAFAAGAQTAKRDSSEAAIESRRVADRIRTPALSPLPNASTPGHRLLLPQSNPLWKLPTARSVYDGPRVNQEPDEEGGPRNHHADHEH